MYLQMRGSTSILGSVFKAWRSNLSMARPPKIILDFCFYPSSMAHFISNPGMKGWKLSGKAGMFKNLFTFQEIYCI
jgi:hypothetical protein